LAPGAALLAIDGEEVGEMTLDEARARLQGEVGQVRRLRVRLPDAADPVEVEVAIEEILP
jgi:C-terminal processing protease CtpA/Prc